MKQLLELEVNEMSFNEEQSTIMSLVSKFGCVSMQQLYDLLPDIVIGAYRCFYSAGKG